MGKLAKQNQSKRQEQKTKIDAIYQRQYGRAIGQKGEPINWKNSNDDFWQGWLEGILSRS